MQLTSRVFEVDDIEAAVEFCYQQSWTDGLPVVPPTRGAIERHLAYLDRKADEVIGVIPPRNGVATMEKVVINCVMAECRPEYACTHVRHRLLLATTYAAGLRVSEAIALKVSDLDADRMTVRVEQGKGAKDRYVPLSKRLLQEWRAYW